MAEKVERVRKREVLEEIDRMLEVAQDTGALSDEEERSLRRWRAAIAALPGEEILRIETHPENGEDGVPDSLVLEEIERMLPEEQLDEDERTLIAKVRDRILERNARDTHEVVVRYEALDDSSNKK